VFFAFGGVEAASAIRARIKPLQELRRVQGEDAERPPDIEIAHPVVVISGVEEDAGDKESGKFTFLLIVVIIPSARQNGGGQSVWD
jgi:hypothetical protein